MDVGINLHDLRGSGRLSALARALGVNELEALGTVTVVWAETQDRELTLVTEESFTDAVALHFDDPAKVLMAMVKARLVSPGDEQETWLINGNDRHVAKLKAYRENARAAGIASATRRQRLGNQTVNDSATTRQPSRQQLGNQAVNDSAPKRSTVSVQNADQGRTLVTGILDTGNRDLTSDPDLSRVQDLTSDPRSLVSSDAKNAVALSAPPSAAADALSVLDVKPPKRKERSPEQKRRSVANARLYCELYERAEGHAPTGLDQSFYGAMAKFSDKHADGAEQILRWVFEHCPDKGFRSKGWPLPLIIEQAPRLWRELNNPRAAIENIAAPRQQRQLSLAANNEIEFQKFLANNGEAPAHAR